MPIHVNTASLFAPKSVAVLGVSKTNEKVGNIILGNLIQAGYPGVVFPVNPQGGTIHNLPILSSVADIPLKHQPLDLAIISLKAELVPEAMHQLGAVGTKAAIIIGTGFTEIGEQGVTREDEVIHIAQRYRIAVLGPDSMGVFSQYSKLNVSTIPDTPSAGNIGFFSQSAALCVALSSWAKQYNIGFSSFASLGNKAMIDESDIIAHLSKDQSTKVIIGYLEQVNHGARFLHHAHLATRQKPVLLFKAGKTNSGTRAISSHTGALSGTDMAFDAACKQTGIIRVTSMDDLFSMAQAFATQPLPKGASVAIISNSGGLGVMAADACDEAKLTIAHLLPSTIDSLQQILPSHASFFNPIDVGCSASAQCIGEVVDTVLNDPVVHSVLLLVTPSVSATAEDIATQVCKKVMHADKTIITCLMGGNSIEAGKDIFNTHNIPCYPFPEPAVKALGAMYKQSLWKENPLPVEVNYRKDTSKARSIIDAARHDNIIELPEFQALALLQAYEMPMLEAKLARTSDEAVQIAKQLGGPVALKIASPQIPHKTDVQGVVLDLDTPEKIRNSFLEVTNNAVRMCNNAYIAGCLIQAMAPKDAREIIIGFTRDKCFGPMVVFGLGGIHVEAFKDISCRLAPLSLDDVHDMVREIKAFPILAGMRGQKPVSFTAIEDILLIMSQLALDFPEIMEAECSPVLVDEHRAYVADVRITLRPERRRTNSALKADSAAIAR